MSTFFYSILFISILYFIFNFVVNKFNILKTKFHNKHQKLIGQESIPQIGGLILFSYLLVHYDQFNYVIILFSFFLFFVGFLSDINFLSSPNKRLLIQFIIIILFLYFYDHRINEIRIEYFDELLENYYVKLIFTAFCLLILINGSNFIDGSNGLNLGYFLSILLVINYLVLKEGLNFEILTIQILLIVVLFLLILNLFNFIYLGDSGAYLIAFLVGIILINIHSINLKISPYFITLLLWYPAFENFFSIIRKRLGKISPLDPDTKHLHQLIYKYLVTKKIKNMYANQLTSGIILFYNIVIFYFSINYISKTNQLVLFLILNISVYLALYNFLKIKLEKKY